MCSAQPGNQRSRMKLWEGATSIGPLFLRPARPGLQGPLWEHPIWGPVQAPFSPLGSFRLSWGIRPGSLPQAGRVVTSRPAPHQRRPEAWAPASAPGPCSCHPVLGLWRLPGAHVQPGLSRIPTSSRRPLPRGHSHPSSAWEALSSGAPPMDSVSAACCSTPRGSGMRRLAPYLSVCWQMLPILSPVESGPTRCPCGPSGLPSLWVLSDARVPPASGSDQVPVCRTQWPPKSWQHLLPPPPLPSPSHFYTRGPRWGQPGAQDKRHRLWKSHQLSHTALKPPLPSRHRRVTFPKTSSFHSRAQGCACGAASSSQDQSLCYCSRWRECGLDPRLRLSEGCPCAAHAGSYQPPP